jgi:DNA invertase Pin-like site-specific DNA recombinase
VGSETAQIATVRDFVHCQQYKFTRPSFGLSGADDIAALRPGSIAWRGASLLQQIVLNLRAKGVALKATEQPIDTGTAAGKCFLEMLSVFAEFETNLRRERQAEGIARAKAAGVYKGRRRSIDPKVIADLRAQEVGATEIARQLGIGRASVYHVLGDA